MREVKQLSRREFLAQGTMVAAAGLAVPYLIPRGVLAAPGKPGANERVTVGVIGTGHRCNLLIDQLPAQAQIASIADCYLTRARDTAGRRKANWRVHQDYRKLLDEKDLDAVIVGTPDHGRVLPCIKACQAGKDIYAEKPLTVCIAEGRALVNAVRKHARICQVGTQQRSMAMNRIACEFIRSGKLG